MNVWEILLLIIFNLILLSALLSSISMAPFVPARTKDLGRIIKIAGLQKGEVFYDIGCGNGKVVLAAGAAGVRAIGIELSFLNYLSCVIRKLFKKSAGVSFRFGNLYKYDLDGADVVYLFGTPSGIDSRLKNKLIKELKPRARVVSYVFEIKGWRPTAIDKPDKNRVAIYLYTIGNI